MLRSSVGSFDFADAFPAISRTPSPLSPSIVITAKPMVMAYSNKASARRVMSQVAPFADVFTVPPLVLSEKPRMGVVGGEEQNYHLNIKQSAQEKTDLTPVILSKLQHRLR